MLTFIQIKFILIIVICSKNNKIILGKIDSLNFKFYSGVEN